MGCLRAGILRGCQQLPGALEGARHDQNNKLTTHKSFLHPQDLQPAAEDLLCSAKRGYSGRVRFLLEVYEKRLAALLIAPEPDSGKTALHLAAEEGWLETVQDLLKAARTAGPLAAAAAAPTHESQGNLFRCSLRGLHRWDNAADSVAGGQDEHGAVSPRVGHGPAGWENGGSAADIQAGGEGLAFPGQKRAGCGGDGAADGYVKGACAEQGRPGASTVHGPLACVYRKRCRPFHMHTALLHASGALLQAGGLQPATCIPLLSNYGQLSLLMHAKCTGPVLKTRPGTKQMSKSPSDYVECRHSVFLLLCSCGAAGLRRGPGAGAACAPCFGLWRPFAGDLCAAPCFPTGHQLLQAAFATKTNGPQLRAEISVLYAAFRH